MSEYKKVKIGDFLEQYRNTIWIDDSVEYGQITISSKDGVKFRCLKIGKEIGRKRQFVIDLKSHPNTVIFTRQGIADGSIGIAPSNVNGCIATENMPMFSVNENIILVEYLENLLISPVFKELVATITPSGSAQKSIHERDLLQLEITLPDLETQKEIVKKVSINLKNVETLTKEIESQKAYAKQLRQNILQDAIEGKLTAEWRKTHPVIKGNPDFDAEALFEEIQKGKAFPSLQPAKQSSATPSAGSNAARNARSKEFPPITDDEKPFDIPDGWKWVRLGEICYKITDGTHKTPSYKTSGVKFVSAKDIYNGYLSFDNCKYISEEEHELLYKRCNPEKNDLLISKSGSIGTVVLNNVDFEFSLFESLALIKYSQLCLIPEFTKLAVQYLCTKLSREDIKGVCVKHLHLNVLSNQLFALPSRMEQIEINKLLSDFYFKLETLQKQILQREKYVNKLMQSILKNTFEER